ncbi:hypothetical protein [Enterococcus faecalis]|nr:hypothetical protein [Enterococcus faecalis]EPI39878.1 hypothetical protein D347_00772 [Enterococcus faecalis LA3B-2]
MTINDEHTDMFNVEIDKKALVIAKESIIIHADLSYILSVLLDRCQ